MFTSIADRRSSLRNVLLMMISAMMGGLLTFTLMLPYSRTGFYGPIRWQQQQSESVTHLHLHENEYIPEEVLPGHGHNEPHHIGEGAVAERLASEVRVLCWVMTRPETHDKKAKHVKATWGKRCNKLIFVSSKDDETLGAVDVKAGDGRDHLWAKTKAAFKYVYEHHLQDYEWFLKADDDTYVIVENLRYMLSAYDSTFPIYFGSRFKKFSKQGYMSGGGGYVLSRAALKLFVEEGLPNARKCKPTGTGAEDAEMGKCLNNLGALAGDSRDSLGRGRFFPFTPTTHLMGGVPKWYNEYVYYKPDVGLDCCSDTAVSFHYVKIEQMYQFEYLLYHLRPYGIMHHDPIPAPLPPDVDSIPKAVLERQQEREAEEKLAAERVAAESAKAEKVAAAAEAKEIDNESLKQIGDPAEDIDNKEVTIEEKDKIN